MGYTGKQVIHPAQVPVVQQAFSPSRGQVTWASGIIRAFHQHQESGKVGGGAGRVGGGVGLREGRGGAGMLLGKVGGWG